MAWKYSSELLMFALCGPDEQHGQKQLGKGKGSVQLLLTDDNSL